MRRPSVLLAAVLVAGSGALASPASAGSGSVPKPSCQATPGDGAVSLGCTLPGTPAGRAVTHLQVDVRQNGQLVASRAAVVPRTQADALTLGGLTNGVPAVLSLRYGSSSGASSAAATVKVTPMPGVSLTVGRARESAASWLPVSVLLTSPSAVPFTVKLAKDASNGRYLGDGPASLTVPAGSLSATGLFAVVPDDVHNSLPIRVDLHPSYPTGMPSSQTYDSGLLIGDAAPIPVIAAVTGPQEVDESQLGSATYVLSLDQPAPLSTSVWVRWGTPRHLQGTSVAIAKGRTTVTLPVSLGTPDDAPTGDRLGQVTVWPGDNYTLMSSFPIVVRIHDDDAPAPWLTLGGTLTAQGQAVRPGVAIRAPLTWANTGTTRATGVRLVASISDSTPLVSPVAGSGVTCAVTSSGRAATVTCDLGVLEPGASGGALLTWVPTTAPQTDGMVALRASLTADSSTTSHPALVTGDVYVPGASCTVTGTLGADTLHGTYGDDVLCGPVLPYAVRDVVVTGAGDDDVLASGIYDFSAAPGPITVSARDGDTVVTGWGTDVIETGLPSLQGQVRGTPYADHLLAGRLGADGSRGDDTIDLDLDTMAALGLQPAVAGGAGVDTLQLLDNTVDALDLTAAPVWVKAVEQVRGTADAETLTVGAGVTRLDGAGGDDVLVATDGVAGDATVVGGDGKDVCTVDAGDTVIGCETITSVLPG